METVARSRQVSYFRAASYVDALSVLVGFVNRDVSVGISVLDGDDSGQGRIIGWFVGRFDFAAPLDYAQIAPELFKSQETMHCFLVDTNNMGAARISIGEFDAPMISEREDGEPVVNWWVDERALVTVQPFTVELTVDVPAA